MIQTEERIESIGRLIKVCTTAWQLADEAQKKAFAAFKCSDKTSETLLVAQDWFETCPLDKVNAARQDVDNAYHMNLVAIKQGNTSQAEANVAFKHADYLFSKLTRAFRSAEGEISELRIRRKLLNQLMRDFYEE